MLDILNDIISPRESSLNSSTPRSKTSKSTFNTSFFIDSTHDNARKQRLFQKTPDRTSDDIKFQTTFVDWDSDESLSFLFDESQEEVDEQVEKLNKLTNYYKTKIKELPPLYVTAAAVISNASSQISETNDGLNLKYNNVIEVKEDSPAKKKPRKHSSDKFNPRFNSTLNGYNPQNGKLSLRSKDVTTILDDSTIKPGQQSYSQLPNISYEAQNSSLSSSFKSNRSQQTMLTMENVSKLVDVLETSGNLETSRLGDTIHNAVTRRVGSALSNRNEPIEESPSSWLGNEELNVRELTEGVRARVINWLVKIDEYAGGEALALQSGAWFLDVLWSRTRSLPAGALLCGAACFWLAYKLLRARAPGAACLARHSGAAFTAAELVRCERTVAVLLDFPPLPLLPADEVDRLAEELELRDGAGVVEGAHYLCCCALLQRHTACLPPGLLAVAALASAARALAPASQANRVVRQLYALSEDISEVVQLQHSLERICLAVASPACACREPFLRYSARKYKMVAPRLAAALDEVYSQNGCSITEC